MFHLTLLIVMLLPFTWNADRETLAGGRLRTRFAVKWHNWLDSNNQWQPIIAAFEQRGNVFGLSKAPYAAECPALANGESRFDSTNCYDIHSKTIRRDPVKGVTKRYLEALPVPGQLTADGVLYPLALPHLNADILIQPHEQQLRHLVRFNSEPPGTGPVVIPIELDIDSLPPIRRVDGELHEFRPEVWHDCDHGVSFASGTFRGVKLKKAWIWDSAGKRHAIQLRAVKRGRHVTLEKVIPRSFFIGAVYPVMTDTTSTFYPDPHTESTSVDGHAYRDVTAMPENFATIRAGNGTNADDSGSTIWARLAGDPMMGGYADMYRAFVNFDTTAIDDGDSISAATLSLWGTLISDSSAAQSVEVVEANGIGSSTAVVSSDYQGGPGSTPLVTGIAIGSIATGSYNVFTMNASGLLAINVGSDSPFAILLSGDLNNSDPSLGGNTDEARFSSADETGTSQDPLLTVTHAAGGGGGGAGGNLTLLGVG